MSDEELDKLFRKSAQKYDPPFDPEAWKAMDSKLDAGHWHFSGIKRFLPLLSLVLLVSMVFVWRGDKVAAPVIQAVTENREDKTTAQDKAARTKHEEDTTKPEALASTLQHPGVQGGSGKVSALTNLPADIRKYRVIKSATATNPESYGPGIQIQLSDKITVAGNTELSDTANYAIPLAATANPNTAAHDSQEKAKAAIPADSTQHKSAKERVLFRNITLSVVIAPDITTVRFKDPDAVSANAGLLVSLPLTKRLSLVSGAIWANKLYNAAPEDYAPYPDYWNGRSAPDVIAADCKVLDIPVNLQYQVLERGKNILTVQAGVSSYIMLNEKYTYTYKYPGKEPYNKTREFSNENQHWFGVQNLSVGYTRQLSPVLSVGAEPFVKLPLKSIGEGRVKLTSAGVFITAGIRIQQTH